MYANQICEILSQDPLTKKHFSGVFPCNASLQPESKKKTRIIIVNTSPLHHKGEHWVTFFKNKNEAIFFDSIARKLENYGPCIYEAFMTFSAGCKHVNFSSKRLQSANSNVCGIYCIYVARELCKGKAINTIEMKFSDNLKLNDYKILQWFKRYLRWRNWMPIFAHWNHHQILW